MVLTFVKYLISTSGRNKAIKANVFQTISFGEGYPHTKKVYLPSNDMMIE